MGFAEPILTSLIRIATSNPKFRHYVTLDTSRVVPVRRVEAFIWSLQKLPRLPGLPYPARWDNSPTRVVSPPRRVCKPNVNGLVDFQRNKLKVTSSRVTRGRVVSGTRDNVDRALEMTTCPRHRDSFGSCWQSGRPIYTIPDEIASAARKSSSVKGLCGLQSNHSAYVLYVYFYILAVCSNRFT